MAERPRLTGQTVREKLAEMQPVRGTETAAISAARLGYRKAASVISVFDPRTLMPIGTEPDPAALTEFVAQDCQLVPSNRGNQWQVRESIRRETLQGMGPEEILRATQANDAPIADPAHRMLQAYAGGKAPPLLEQTANDLYGTLQASGWLEPGIMSVPNPDEVRSRLQLSALLDPLRHLVGSHFMGRQSELDQLYNYVEVFPPTSQLEVVTRLVRAVLSFEQKPPLMIHGPGGVGKSTLIAKFLTDYATVDEAFRFPYAYLNCDRADLSPGEPITFLVEAAGQLGGQYSRMLERTDRLRDRWLGALIERRSVAAESEMQAWSGDTAIVDAVQQFAALLRDIEKLGPSDVPFLMVFDTFEEIQRGGSPAVESVWRCVELLQPAFPLLRTVFVGRAPIAGHKTINLALKQFSNDTAQEFLRAELQFDPAFSADDLIAWTVKRVGGSPLALRLAAEVLRREGPDGLSDIGRRRLWIKRVDEMQIEGMLYRRVLDHIDDPDVRRIASPGLVLRRITPDLIMRVLAKPCELKIEDEVAARRLFDGLKAEAALVEEAEDGVALYHRVDVRRIMLEMLRQDDPKKFEQINRRAVAYYSGRHDPRARAEEIYHRLCLGQGYATLDKRWDNAARDYLRTAFDELPATGQAFLALKLGLTVSSEVLQQADDETWRRQMTRQAASLIQLGRFDEALRLLVGRRDKDGHALLPMLEAQVLRLMGRLAEARQVALAGLDQAVESRDIVAAARLNRLLAQLAEELGDPSEAISRILEANNMTDKEKDPTSWLTGMVIEYRLYRKLGLLAPLLRSELRDEILTVATRLPKQQFDAHPELLRDLAAEFASEDLQIATESVRVLNLGAGVNIDQAIDLLAPALDLWSKGLAESGEPNDVLLDSARIEGQGQEAWRSWLREQPQTEWSSALQRLLVDYPVATGPIQTAVEQVFRLVTRSGSQPA